VAFECFRQQCHPDAQVPYFFLGFGLLFGFGFFFGIVIPFIHAYLLPYFFSV